MKYRLTYVNVYRGKEILENEKVFLCDDDDAACEKAKTFIKQKNSSKRSLEKFVRIKLVRIDREAMKEKTTRIRIS